MEGYLIVGNKAYKIEDVQAIFDSRIPSYDVPEEVLTEE